VIGVAGRYNFVMGMFLYFIAAGTVMNMSTKCMTASDTIFLDGKCDFLTVMFQYFCSNQHPCTIKGKGMAA
jgi:hypothetical protein